MKLKYNLFLAGTGVSIALINSQVLADAASDAAALAITDYYTKIDTDAKTAAGYSSLDETEKLKYDLALASLKTAREKRDSDEKTAAGFSGFTDAQKTIFDTQLLAFQKAKAAACETEAVKLDFIACDKADALRANIEVLKKVTSDGQDTYYKRTQEQRDAEDITIAAAQVTKKKEFVDAKTAADKVIADKAAADKVIADKAAADKVIADKAAADKVIADKAAADAAAAAAKALEKPKCEDAGVLLAKSKLVPLQSAISLAKEKYDKIKKDYAVAGVESSYAIEEKVKATKVHTDAQDQKNIADGKTESIRQAFTDIAMKAISAKSDGTTASQVKILTDQSVAESQKMLDHEALVKKNNAAFLDATNKKKQAEDTSVYKALSVTLIKDDVDKLEKAYYAAQGDMEYEKNMLIESENICKIAAYDGSVKNYLTLQAEFDKYKLDQEALTKTSNADQIKKDADLKAEQEKVKLADLTKANQILAAREKAATALAASSSQAGKTNFRCEREKQSDGANEKGSDGKDVPRPKCDEGLCCGAAQKQEGTKTVDEVVVPNMVGAVIETCQLTTTLNWQYQGPSKDGVKPKAETWNFACIESAVSLASSAISFLTMAYILDG